MKFKPLSSIKSKEEARQIAINYQSENSNKSISYGELVIFQEYFKAIAKKLGLTKEFKENGII